MRIELSFMTSEGDGRSKVNVGNTEDVDETERKTNVKWFLNCLCTRP
jgi:hypothetical protein